MNSIPTFNSLCYRMFYNISRTSPSSDSKNSFMLAIFCRIRSEINFVVRLPVFNHINFGGNPLTTIKSTKSESKVTIVYLFSLANSYIAASEASWSPTWSTCFEPGKEVSSCLTILGEIFWSNNNFKRQSLTCALYQQQNQDRR